MLSTLSNYSRTTFGNYYKLQFFCKSEGSAMSLVACVLLKQSIHISTDVMFFLTINVRLFHRHVSGK